jgi:hypothetical protein
MVEGPFVAHLEDNQDQFEKEIDVDKISAL